MRNLGKTDVFGESRMAVRRLILQILNFCGGRKTGEIMSNIKNIQIGLLALFLIIGLGLSSSQANQNDGDNILPIVCIPDEDCRLYVNSVNTQPGVDTVEVPISIDYWDNVIMSELVFSLSIEEGIEYVGCNADDWEGDIFDTCYAATRQVEIQCYNDTLNLYYTRSPLVLVFTLDEGVGFDSTINLTFTGTIYFKFYENPLAYDPQTFNGYVRTYDDDVEVDVGEVIGYSYQAWDTLSAAKSEMYVRVPIEFYTCFRAGYLNFYLKNTCPNYKFAGYDSAAFGVSVWDECDTLIRVNGVGLDIPSGTDTTLVQLLYRIDNFAEQYDSDLDYDTTLNIPAFDAIGWWQRVTCYGSNHYVDLVAGTNFFGGSISLPECQATFDIINANVDINHEVALPVELEPTFYAQFYENYIEFNGADLHCNSISAGPGSVPQDVELTYIDTLSDYHTIRITATNLRDYEYIPPDESTVIYYVHFTANESFDSTAVDFSENWYEGKVLDFFPEESWGEIDHVSRIRTDEAPYFETFNGTVYNYGVQPVAPIQPFESNEESPGIVSIDEGGSIPFAYALDQNFPNPFNATTNISFGLAESGPVRIEIYDILGQKVKTLVADDLQPGPHYVVWNGNNNDGKQVSSGCYFYILTAKDFRQSKQMLLLK